MRASSASQVLAGWLFAGQSAATLFAVIVTNQFGRWLGSDGYVIAAAIDAALATHILTGGARFALLAAIRVALGTVLFAIVAIAARSMAVVPVVASGLPLLFLLVANPRQRARRIAAALAGAGILGSIALPVRDHQALAAELPPPPSEVRRVVGNKLPYSFELPPGWTSAVPEDQDDVALIKSDIDAYLQVFVSEYTGVPACLDCGVAAILRNGRTLVEQSPIPRLGDRATLLRYRRTAEGSDYDAWMAMIVTRKHVVQIIVTARSSVFSATTQDIERVLSTIELPAELTANADGVGEPLPRRYADETIGYSLDFPPGWHERALGDDDESEFEIEALRPFQGASVVVEIIEAPTPFRWKDIDDSILQAIRGEAELEVLDSGGTDAPVRVLRARTVEQDLQMEFLIGLRRFEGSVVAVRLFAPAPAFARLEKELRAIAGSLAPAPRKP